MRKILQMMPASDWFAVFDDGGTVHVTPLAGWAAVEEEGHYGVVGLDAVGTTVEYCDELSNFLGYAHVSEKPADNTATADWRDAHG